MKRTTEVIEKSTNYNELVSFMGKCANVRHWNEKREHAKVRFAHMIICKLDASGYIYQSLKRN